MTNTQDAAGEQWRKEGLSLPEYDGNQRVEVATYILDGKRYHLREKTGDRIIADHRKASQAEALALALENVVSRHVALDAYRAEYPETTGGVQ